MIFTDQPLIIFLSVLGGILALALLLVAAAIAVAIILLAIRAKLTIEFNEIFSLWVSFLGIKFKILPKKPKKYNIRNYTPEKIAKRDAKAAKAAARKAEADAKRKAEKAKKKRKKKALKNKMTREEKKAARAEKQSKIPPIGDMLDLFFKVIELLTSNFIKHFHFHVVRIRIKVGSEDAARTAMLTTAIGMAIEPLLVFLDRNSNLHGKSSADIDISPDYLSETIKYDVKLAFSMSLGSLIWILLRAGIPAVVGWIKIQPTDTRKLESAKSAAPAGKVGDTSKSAESTPTGDGGNDTE